MSLLEVNYQHITLLKLSADSGLFVLIWMVQLIIYPSFLHYTSQNLIAWHLKYTKRIAIIVIPLMFTQLIIGFYDIFYQFNALNTMRFLMILLLWIFTFTSFVPLHHKISEGKFDKKLLQLLVQRNWMRTLLWTVLLVFYFF